MLGTGPAETYPSSFAVPPAEPAVITVPSAGRFDSLPAPMFFRLYSMYRKVPVSVMDPFCGAAVRSMMLSSGRTPAL